MQIFKRALDETYRLKMRASRDLFSQINRKAPTMPFNLRMLEGKGLRLVRAALHAGQPGVLWLLACWLRLV